MGPLSSRATTGPWLFRNLKITAEKSDPVRVPQPFRLPGVTGFIITASRHGRGRTPTSSGLRRKMERRRKSGLSCREARKNRYRASLTGTPHVGSVRGQPTQAVILAH